MHYEPRTIAFLTEVLHPPVATDPRLVQRVHNRMFEGGDPLYKSFTVAAESAVLSNPTSQPGAVSSAAVLPDRIQFREELSGLTTDEFVTRVLEVTRELVQARQIQIITAHVVTVRTLINPQNFRDSRLFLREGLFGFGAELAALGREPQLYGLRMVFPPTADAPHAFSLRVESFANDPRSLFLENQASFGPLLPAQGLDALAANVHATYDFVVDRALAFVRHFDARQEA
jgi:hypothetical protein